MAVKTNSLFAFSSGGEYETSAQKLEDLLLRYQQDHATALVQVLSPPENRLLFPLLEGNLITVYLTSGQVTKKISPGEVNHWLENKAARARTISLPVDAIRLSKLAAEMPVPSSSRTLKTATLKTQIEGWAASAQGQLVDCRWEHALGTFYLPGFGTEANPIVFMNEFQVLVGQDAWLAIDSWQEPDCHVTLTSGDETIDAVKEHRLYLAFTNIIGHIQKRYNDMVGARLLENLNHDFNQAASVQNWHIKASSRHVLDNQIFSSPEQACSAYKLLLTLCLTQIETVIGPKYTSMLTSEAIKRLDPLSRAIVLQCSLFRPPWTPSEKPTP
jgi:hypothetical protein